MKKKKSTFSVTKIDEFLCKNAIDFDYLTIEEGIVKYHKKGNTEGSLSDPVTTEPKGEAIKIKQRIAKRRPLSKKR